MQEKYLKKKMDEEKEAQRNHDVGISIGLECAGQYLMSKALQKFEAGDDFSATMIRDFATFFLNQSKLVKIQ